MKSGLKLILAMMLSSLSTVLSAAGMGVMVDNGWIREAPPGAKAMAAYMSVMNHGNSEKVLVGASSGDFENVMLHRTIVEGGMAKMVHQMAIAIPPGGEVLFEPNGYHIMLMGPKRTLKAGDKVVITLKFKGGETLKIDYAVRAEEAAHSMDHSMGHGAISHNH